MSELRQQPRVAYQTRIRLRAHDQDHSVVARVQNLSAGGIFVIGPTLPSPGSKVLCRLALAGERRTLRGRVAWVTSAAQLGVDQDAGAGIQFLDLTRKDADLLARLIEPRPEDQQPVDVWFEGLRAPIRSHAVVMAEGLRLSTRLPFLRLSSEVRVSLVQHGIEESRVGTLDSVTMQASSEDGVPCLYLNVSTPMLDSVQGTIETAPTDRHLHDPFMDQPRSAADPGVVDPVTRGPGPDDTQRFRREGFGSPPGDGRPGFDRQRSPNDQTSLQVSLGDSSETTQRFRWEPPPPTAPPVPLANVRPPARRGALLAALLIVGVGLGGWAVGRATSPGPRVVSVPVQPPVAAAPPSGVTIQPLPAVLPDEKAPAAAPKVEPDLAIEEGGAVPALRVALQGGTRGLRAYPLARPPGTGVNLPGARPRAAPGVYRPGEPFDLVLIQRRGAGSHVRVHHDRGLVADVNVVDGYLRIVLRPR